jgi:ABC-2 type transport system ATP-binding protein
LWDIILQLVREQGLTVLLSTAYLGEAERCGHVVVLHEGKVLAQGPPGEISRLANNRTFLVDPPQGQAARDLQARLLDRPDVVDAVPEGGRVRLVLANEEVPESNQFENNTIEPTQPRFEDGFMVLFRQTVERHPSGGSMELGSREKHRNGAEGEAVEVRDLVRQFGTFTAVDRISFDVRRGEIFGLLGPNGAGKTTTFRMLCGLLASTTGTLKVAGVDLRHARASARQRIGYVAQKFSLYPQLSVTENLDFFASAYSLRGKRKRDRIAWALEQFELKSLARLPTGQLPGGFKQRLAMAAALLHEPEILFLDEPTSGADPLARREFWRRITSLSEQGVTVIATTHFMEEAEYCDHIAILAGGRILAHGTPAEVRSRGKAETGRTPTMEDAFIAIVEEGSDAPHAPAQEGPHPQPPLPWGEGVGGEGETEEEV